MEDHERLAQAITNADPLIIDCPCRYCDAKIGEHCFKGGGAHARRRIRAALKNETQDEQ